MSGVEEDHQDRGGSCEVLQKITRSAIDHDRCFKRSPGPRWIMIGAAEEHQDRGGS